MVPSFIPFHDTSEWRIVYSQLVQEADDMISIVFVLAMSSSFYYWTDIYLVTRLYCGVFLNLLYSSVALWNPPPPGPPPLPGKANL